jgi:hypothetical protein
VAEQLRLEERLAQRRAAHLDERAIAPWRLLVQRLGDELLARAGLAQDEDRRLGGGGLLHQLEHGLQFRRFADHSVQAEPLVHALSQRPRVALQTALLDGFGEKDEERLDRDRLGQVVLGPRLHRLDRRLDLGERGHDDEDGVRPLLLRLPQQGEAVHLRHPQIGEHDARCELAQQLEPFLPVLCLADLVALLGEEALERAARVLLIVDQQDPFRSHGRISTCEF